MFWAIIAGSMLFIALYFVGFLSALTNF